MNDNEIDRDHFHCMDGSGVNYVACYEITHCPSYCECAVDSCDALVVESKHNFLANLNK